MRDEDEANRVVEQYADLVRRICFMHLKNEQDTEDIFQIVFLKYILYSGVFENAEHEKAWFIRVTVNACKDLIRSMIRHACVPLDTISEEAGAISDEGQELLQTVLSLPQKYKAVIYLFYYEGYTAIEIAGILHKNENTVYSLLSRARKKLKEQLGGEMFAK